MAQVEKSLPPKNERILRIEMTPLQKQYYKVSLLGWSCFTCSLQSIQCIHVTDLVARLPIDNDLVQHATPGLWWTWLERFSSNPFTAGVHSRPQVLPTVCPQVLPSAVTNCCANAPCAPSGS
jgi:hypothetical protein